MEFAFALAPAWFPLAAIAGPAVIKFADWRLSEKNRRESQELK